MKMQRPLNSAFKLQVGRDGRVPKNIANAPIKPGMVRQTKGEMHPWAHGRPLDDEPLEKNFVGKEVQPHPSMKSRPERGSHIPGLASEVLNEAARLGRPKEITDKDNGRSLDGGSAPRPVTTR